MKLIEINALKDIFLELLDESKYLLLNAGLNEIDDIDYRSKMFTEYGIYDESIKQVLNTETNFITPGLFVVDGGEILNNPNYDCYVQEVAFEFLGFEAQRESFRKLLEMFAGYIRGKSITIYYDTKTGVFHYNDGYTGGTKYNCVIETELPVLSETVQQSGYDRFQAYINMTITVLLDIELANDINFTVDGERVSIVSLNIKRNKLKKAFNVRTLETQSYAENQSISISFNGVLKGSSKASQKIKNSILTSSYLNEPFNIVYEGCTYKMFLEGGELEIIAGSPITYTAQFTTLKEI